MATAQTDRSTSEPPRSLFGRPYAWLWLAIGLTAVPLCGYMLRAGMSWSEAHPALNAMLNATSAVFLVAGYLAIKRGDRDLHRRCMVTAVAASTVFLASYLTRYYLEGTHRYPGEGWDKILYLVILFSHMVLAAAVMPMIARALYLAWRGRYERHRALARWTWPIWIYVSVTGVAVYVMLYLYAGAR